MSLNLINSNGLSGISYGLYTKVVDIVDTQYLSQFFVVSEFNPTFSPGKNAISFAGSTYLKAGSQILIECLDSAGNNLYIEMAQSSNGSLTYAYKEGQSFVISILVFGDTAEGTGKLIFSGTLVTGQSTKWTANITINKSFNNNSKVRFYQTPTLDIDPVTVPVLSSSINWVTLQTLTGTVNGLSVSPSSNTNLSTINQRNTTIDYRLTLINPIVTNNTPDTGAFNFQMVGSTITLNINTIQSPISQTQLSISQTASYTITNVINNNTLQISIPYYYNDTYGNNTVTNILNANFSIQYPFVTYNTEFIYQKSTVNEKQFIVLTSYADIIFQNIRTFSGYVNSYKIYRRSLLSNAGFSVIANEPIIPNEILINTNTQNSFYNSLGTFYNQQHISNYWFTSSNNLSLTYTPNTAVNTMFVSSPVYDSLSGSGNYLMVKTDSISTSKKDNIYVTSNRNATYIPFDMSQFLAQSGSSYDSNFILLNRGVQYIIETSVVILKDPLETNAALVFYLTGSVTGSSGISSLSQEPSYTNNFGVVLSNLTGSQMGVSSINIDNNLSFYIPQNDLYGTLVVVPYLCQAYIENISIRVFGDNGFSPDIFTTRIPWNVSTANEIFQVEFELFDINNNLAYSSL